MSKTRGFENDFLELIFHNVGIANIGDATGIPASSTAGSLYVALYTTTPTNEGSGTETTYTGYSRVAVTRAASAWNVVNGSSSNTNAITFAENTGGGVTITGFAILTASTGGDMLFWGDLQGDVTIGTNQVFEFAAGALQIFEY